MYGTFCSGAALAAMLGEAVVEADAADAGVEADRDVDAEAAVTADVPATETTGGAGGAPKSSKPEYSS